LSAWHVSNSSEDRCVCVPLGVWSVLWLVYTVVLRPASVDCHGVVAAAIRQTVYQVKILEICRWDTTEYNLHTVST